MRTRVLDSVIREAAALAAESAAGSAADADLLRRFARTKDEAAFAELLRRHARLVWAVCRQSLPTEADAEDAFQAVFLALARGANRVHDPAAVAGWLHATAVRVAAFARRSAARRKNREQAASVAEAQHPVSDQAWADLLAAVHDEVARLPDALRAAFVVCDLEGVPQAEAAARLGWKPGTLTGRLCKARHRLLERLTRRGLAPAGGVIGCGIGAGSTAAVPPGLIQRAVGFAANPAAIPATVTELAYRITEGVMTRTKLMLAGLMVAGAVGLGTGAVVMSQDPTTGSTSGSTTGTSSAGSSTSTSGDATTGTTSPDPLPGEAAPQGPTGGNAGPSPRARVEHKLVDLKDDGRDTLENVLRAQGNQGWEFCSVQRVSIPNGGGQSTMVAVFKRPVPTTTAWPTGTGAGGIAGPGMMPPGGGKWNVSDEALATSFNRLDKNGDGRLTEDELKEPAWNGWRAFDANKDGALDLKEYRAYLESRLNNPNRGAATGAPGGIPGVGGDPLLGPATGGTPTSPNSGSPPTGFNPLNTLGLGGPSAGGVPTAAEDIHLIWVKNADPQKLMTLVFSLLDSTDGISKTAVDPDARVLIVKGTATGVAKVRVLVEKLDLPPAKK